MIILTGRLKYISFKMIKAIAIEHKSEVTKVKVLQVHETHGQS